MGRAFAAIAVIALVLAGDMALAQQANSKEKKQETEVTTITLPVVKCADPVGNVSIGEFDCKAANCGDSQNDSQAALLAQALGHGGVQGVGKGLRNMLTTAIKESGCFKVIDLDQFKKLSEKLAATGQVVKPPQIDYFINGTITSIELSKTKKGLGVGASLGGLFGAVGAVAGVVAGAVRKDEQKAKMGVDVEIIDPSTLEVTASRALQADSEKSSWGIGGGGYGGGVGGLGGFSLSENMALDNVARSVIIESANFVCENLAGEKIAKRPDEQEAVVTADKS